MKVSAKTEYACLAMLELAARYGVPEVVVVTITYDFAARLRSYELLAQVFDLKQQ